jgi:hypothetical protein
MENNLCKKIVNSGGNLVPLIISKEFSGGTGLMNPSIFVDKEKILINIRNINYILWHNEGDQQFNNRWGPLCYLHPENDQKLKTTNFIVELDDNLNIINYKKVNTSELDSPAPLWDFHGLEDARLIKWKNEFYLSGVRRDTTPNGVGRIELSKLNQHYLEIKRTRIEPPKSKVFSYCEKNWMPILDMPFHYIKWSNPTEVVKIVENQAETVFLSKNIIPDLPDFRGGSQVIPMGKTRIALVHQVNLFNNRLNQKDGIYRHRFIVWDDDWNIVHISKPFSFLTGNIEFCCGMAFYKEDLLISFGFQDNAAFLLRVPKIMVERIIYE